jgi:hypothetical protein
MRSRSASNSKTQPESYGTMFSVSGMFLHYGDEGEVTIYCKPS